MLLGTAIINSQVSELGHLGSVKIGVIQELSLVLKLTWILSPLRQTIMGHQSLKQRPHLIQRDHVWSIGGGMVRVLMGFHEHGRNSHRNGRAGKNRNEFALASCRAAQSARLLN